MSGKMNIEECAEMLAEKLPDGRRIYANHINIYGEVLLHVLVGDMIDRPLVELLRSEQEPDLIKIYCDAVEEMWIKGDDNVVNVVEVTILEYITDDDEVWQRFGRYISRNFRYYINNEFIPDNLHYINVESLKE
ncbi:hypothetical protein [Ruminococcus sp.]|uniref:DUF7674 family protein n=1 Tax=Ruminococcus sp. TaxID=41978 RepID=UPI0025CC89A2|nr:hypothetical protein [Ruminococcus sp.]